MSDGAVVGHQLWESSQPPVDVLIGRFEDMSQFGRLMILHQDDGDYCVSVVDADGVQADIEFCAMGAGGGHSPRTLQALRALSHGEIHRRDATIERGNGLGTSASALVIHLRQILRGNVGAIGA